MKKTITRGIALLLALLLAFPWGLAQAVFASSIATDGRTSYLVELGEGENGSISFAGTDELAREFLPGDTVQLVLHPEEGYRVQSFALISAASGETIDSTEISDTDVSFVMPEDDLVVSAVFAPVAGSEAADSAEEGTGDVGQEKAVYKVETAVSENGSLSVENGMFHEGDRVILTVDADEGYTFTKVNAEGADIALTMEGGSYAFTMPAADIKLEGVFEKDVVATGVEEYIADNVTSTVNKAVKSGRKIDDISIQSLEGKDLKETGHHVYIKYTEADKGMLKDNLTIDQVWENVPEAMMAVYGGIADVYEVSEDNEYYVAFLDSPKFNGTGELLDAEFSNANNYSTGNVAGIKFDKAKGIAYIPKSIYEENGKEVAYALEAQLLYAFNFKTDAETQIPVAVENHKTGVKVVADEQTISVPSLDVTTTIPVVDAKSAGKLSLEDFTVYVNDEAEPFCLSNKEGETTALYDSQTGELTICCSPVAVYALRIVIGGESVMETVSSAISGAWKFLAGIADVQAEKNNVSTVEDLNTLPGTRLTDLDLTTLAPSQLYAFETPVNYTYGTKIATSNSALCKCIRKSAPYCYMYNYYHVGDNDSWKKMVDLLYGDDGEEKATWDSLIKKGHGGNPYLVSSQGAPGMGIEDYTFAIRPIHGECSTVNTDEVITQNFGNAEQWGITSGFDPDEEDAKDSASTKWKRRRLALHCAHSDTELEERDDDDNENTSTCYCRILYVDKEPDANNRQYMVVGFVTPQVTTQQGAGVYKIRIKNSTSKMRIKKAATDTVVVKDNENYSLAGAKFGIYDDGGDRVGTLITDEKGETPEISLPAGVYTVKETKAPKGYKKSDEVKTVELVPNTGKTTEISFKDEPYVGAIQVKKTSRNPDVTNGNRCYSLANASFDVVKRGTDTVVATGSTGEESNGEASVTIDNIPLGDYTLKEKASSAGFGTAANVDFSITEKNASGVVDIPVALSVDEPEITDPLTIALIKRDESGSGIAQGAGTLAGAEFTISYYDAQLTLEQAKAASPIKTWVIQTKEETLPLTGEKRCVAKFDESHLVKEKSDDFYYNIEGHIVIPLGTITIKETKAPIGYVIEGAKMSLNGATEVEEICQNIVQHGGGYYITGSNDPNAETIEIFETPIRGGVKINKRDIETGEKAPQGDATLAGAKFAIINENDAPVLVENKEYASGEKVYTMVTDENGYAETANDLLPYGDYTIHEMEAPEGYNNTGIIDQRLEIRENKVIVDKTSVDTSICNNPGRGNFFFIKRDEETGDGLPLGGANLRGTYTVTNTSDHDVLVDTNQDGEYSKDERYAPNQVVFTFETDAENGSYTAPERLLPYGSYKITEVVPPEGYLMLSNSNPLMSIPFKIENDGACVDLSHSITNYVKRGDIKFIKRSGQDSKTMSYIPFKITALDRDGNEIESHIVYTDENGVFDSSAAYVLHTYETNKGDEWYAAYLAEYEKTGQWPTNEEIGIAGPVGTWFGVKAPVKDSLRLNQTGALPYGTYQVEELCCEANVGMNLYTDRFTITYEAASDKDAVIDPDGTKQGNMSGTLNYGTILNFNNNGQVPKIQTEALLQDTNSHYGSTRSDLVVIDTVTYSGLKPGNEYTLEGSLLLTDTGDVLHDAMGEDAKTKLTFTPDLPNGSVVMRFDLDATGLDSKTAVVTEVLYDMDGAVVATHTDIDDVNQQIHFPGVQTQACGEYMDDPMVGNTKELTITDTITYTGLEPGRVYRAVGYLVDRQTGDYVLDDAGCKITEQQNFKPETSDGMVEMAFAFDAETLAGKSLVAFEEIYQGGVLVAFHRDIDDKKQTVDIPKIRTTAKDEVTDSHMSFAAENMVIVDTICYEGLEPGCSYTAVGTLYDKDKKEPALDDKGNEIMAQTEFVAGEKDGSVDVIFHFSGKDLAGRSLVAYEKLYYANAEIAKHEDPEDEDQTVDVPKIGTTAMDKATGSHYAEAGTIVITDTVAYEKLTPGEEYTVSGELVNGETGESLGITAEAAFIPEETSGTVDVQFTVDATNLTGQAIIVFESLTVNGHVIAEHKDLEDEGQSVHVVEIKTTATDKETGTKVVSRGKKACIVDTVAYTGLIPGVEYTMKGTLMDKETGKNIGAAAERTFTPDNTSGSMEMEFVVNAEELEGHVLVAFEKLFIADIQIAHHEDITDTEQAVYVPRLHTTAAIGGKHEADASQKTTLVDKVAYENLVPDVEYTVTGVLMDKETRKPLRISGKEIKSQVKFKPDKPKGTVEMTFTFDSTGMDGTELVAFEELFIGKTLVGQHKDLDDKNQTVKFRGKKPEDSTPTNTTSKRTGKVRTGDDYISIYVVMSVAAVMALAVFLLRRRKK